MKTWKIEANFPQRLLNWTNFPLPVDASHTPLFMGKEGRISYNVSVILLKSSLKVCRLRRTKVGSTNLHQGKIAKAKKSKKHIPMRGAWPCKKRKELLHFIELPIPRVQSLRVNATFKDTSVSTIRTRFYSTQLYSKGGTVNKRRPRTKKECGRELLLFLSLSNNTKKREQISWDGLICNFPCIRFSEQKEFHETWEGPSLVVGHNSNNGNIHRRFERRVSYAVK